MAIAFFVLMIMAAPSRAEVDDVCRLPSEQQSREMPKKEMADLVCAVNRAIAEHSAKAVAITAEANRIPSEEREAGLKKINEGLIETALHYRCIAVAQGILRVADKRFGNLIASAS